MSVAVYRLVLFGIGVAAGAVPLWAAFTALPGFGHYPGPYGDIVDHLATALRHTTNAVTAINFDIRGLDTLGEEFILFAAVTGVILLLRTEKGEDEHADEQGAAEGRPELPRSDISVAGAGPYVGILLLFGIYVILHAALTPGGGFQGGAIAGSASVVVYLARSYHVFRDTANKDASDVAEAFGAGAYALIGIATLVAGGVFLQNMLPFGKVDSLFSSGTIVVINLFVGLEVAAGFAVLVAEFVEEIRRGPAILGEDGA